MRLYKLYILDLDGTLFRGRRAIPHAVETVRELRRLGARIRYLTNNSGLTRNAYVAKLQGMGFEAEEREVYSSAIGTADYCSSIGAKDLFVVGEPGLVETLRDAGLSVINAGSDGRVTADARQADALVAGIHRGFSYELMAAAMSQVRGGARFIATNADATYPVEDGLIPGAGAIVAALRTCTETEPYVVGKPNPYLVELVMREAGVAPGDTLVVGDRYETDILSGQRAGCDTHLVLTGVSKEAPAGQSWSEDLTTLQT